MTETETTIKAIVTSEGATFVLPEGRTLLVSSKSEKFIPALQALQNNDTAQLEKLLSPGASIETWSRGKFRFQDGNVIYEDRKLPSTLSNKLLTLIRDNSVTTQEAIEGLCNFWERLQKNPSFRSVEQLHAFLENNRIPITKEGYLLTYKAVDANFMDYHTRTIRNAPGDAPSMPRNMISDDPDLACSFGYHSGGLNYVRGFAEPGGHIVIVQLDPAHVVCVPRDASAGKVRMEAYKVIGLYTGTELGDSMIQGDDLPGFDDDDGDYDADSDDNETLPMEDTDDDGSGDICDDPECDVCASWRDANVTPGEQKLSSELSGVAALTVEVEAELPLVLETMTLNELRAYAKGLGIKNVNSILGGKVGLITAIRQVTEDQNTMDKEAIIEDLRTKSLDELRKLAAREYKIVGASKVLGGKEALIEIIKTALGQLENI